MAATTAYTDGSGEILIEEIRTLQYRLEELDKLVANRLLCPELPAVSSELLSFDWSSARIAVTQASTMAECADRANELLSELEAMGRLVERVDFAMIADPVDLTGITYGVCILHRAGPAGESDAP